MALLAVERLMKTHDWIHDVRLSTHDEDVYGADIIVNECYLIQIKGKRWRTGPKTKRRYLKYKEHGIPVVHLRTLNPGYVERRILEALEWIRQSRN